ncbi:MAG: ABC transporter permease [Cyclobacteriaceae bacterium]
MLRNFIKITFRNFTKNKSYVIINLAGLGLALSCCIVAYLNLDYTNTFDQNHVNHERIYKIHINKSVQSKNVPYGITPLPLGTQIKDQVTGIKYASRFTNDGLVLKKENKVFNERIAFADDDFMKMFTFPFKYGSKESLNDRSSIVLSEQAAQTYFDEEDPTGQLITLVKEDGTPISMTVGGVLEDIPMNSSIHFSAITHFDNYLKIRDIKDNDWSRFVAATFVMTESTEFPQNLLDNLNENFISIQNEARNDFQIGNYYFEQLTYLGVHVVDSIRANWLSEPPPPPAVLTPVIMAVLLLLIACFNFTNTSIAISSKRLKEIGIRKVMGSSRKQLILQFLGENLILSFGAMLVAIALANVLVPAYSAMWDFIDLDLNLIGSFEIYVFLVLLLIFTSVVAGAYPSLYISGYQPVSILRGSVTLGGANWFSKSLLGFQYLFTAIALISSLAFGNNARYQSEADMGFRKDNIIGVRVESQADYEKFYNQVSQLPEVEQITGTTHHIGWWTYGRTLKSAENDVEAEMMNLSANYQEIMDLKMVKGRFFSEDLAQSDREQSIIVNETLVKEMAWEEPIGKVLKIDDSTRLNVIGVMKDFYMQGFFTPVSAAAYRLADKDNYNFVIIKSQVSPTKLRETLEAKWYEVAPNTPFNSQIQNAVLEDSEYVNNNIETMFRFLGIVALLLSSIGLYTLVSLNVIKRVKEIGVRKVLGASVGQIVVLINHKFFWLLFVSSAIGAALSYFAIDALMGSIFSVYEAANMVTVLVPFVTLILLAVLIASLRIASSAVKNPVNSLRSE